MNKRESAIITAYTGVSFGSAAFSAFHKYIEEKMNNHIFSHEMAYPEFWEKAKELSKNDFMMLAKSLED